MSSGLLIVSSVVYVAPQSDWTFPLHKHDDACELSYVLSGRGTFYHDKRTRVVSSGMVVVKNAGLSHAEWSDPEDPLEQVCISVSGVRLEGLRENQVIPDTADPVVILGDERGLVEAGFLYLREHGGDESCATTCGKVADLVIDLVRGRAGTGELVPASPKMVAEQLVAAACDYLDEHFREKVRIRELAGMLYTSEGNLSRQFKRATGFTVNEYLISKRMGEAQRLLVFGDLDVKEVARSCGYDNVQYFYHVFGERAHCTPVEFRRRYRR